MYLYGEEINPDRRSCMRTVSKTVIGVDFGTQSARAVLVNTENGKILYSCRREYPRSSTPVPAIDCAENLPCATDYEMTLYSLLCHVVPEDYRKTVAGICVDATSLTMILLAKDGRALSELDGWSEAAHARVKLWKYHRAQEKADEALNLARNLQEPFLGRTGGSISCEWMLPKLLEVRDEAPEIYAKIDLAMDLCEFLTYRLTGQLVRSIGSLSYKCLWAEDFGFPEQTFLNGLRTGFYEEYCYFLRGDVRKPGECAGMLQSELAKRWGLPEKIPVATGVLDGHTSLATMGAFEPGDAALIVGTSNVCTVQDRKLQELKDVCGVAQDGMVTGSCGIDTGQSSTGNMLGWYIEHMAGWQIHREAKERKISPHQVLAERIQKPWENKVIAVDWWSGSRNAPCDLTLRGCMSGLEMDTRTEDIYLALLQAIACGTGTILESLSGQSVKIGRVLATGGITEKNPLLMQEYANLLRREVLVAKTAEGPALGAAMFAAMAAGIYTNIQETYAHMGIHDFKIYKPDEIHRAAYEELYRKNKHLRNMLSGVSAGGRNPGVNP